MKQQLFHFFMSVPNQTSVTLKRSSFQCVIVFAGSHEPDKRKWWAGLQRKKNETKRFSDDKRKKRCYGNNDLITSRKGEKRETHEKSQRNKAIIWNKMKVGGLGQQSGFIACNHECQRWRAEWRTDKAETDNHQPSSKAAAMTENEKTLEGNEKSPDIQCIQWPFPARSNFCSSLYSDNNPHALLPHESWK